MPAVLADTVSKWAVAIIAKPIAMWRFGSVTPDVRGLRCWGAQWPTTAIDLEAHDCVPANRMASMMCMAWVMADV